MQTIRNDKLFVSPNWLQVPFACSAILAISFGILVLLFILALNAVIIRYEYAYPLFVTLEGISLLSIQIIMLKGPYDFCIKSAYVKPMSTVAIFVGCPILYISHIAVGIWLLVAKRLSSVLWASAASIYFFRMILPISQFFVTRTIIWNVIPMVIFSLLFLVASITVAAVVLDNGWLYLAQHFLCMAFVIWQEIWKIIWASDDQGGQEEASRPAMSRFSVSDDGLEWGITGTLRAAWARLYSPLR